MDGARERMERWVPLFDIFLNSPSAEGEAALWFQNQPNNSPTTPQLNASFLSLLLAPSSSSSTPLLYIDTLPHSVQSRILSFLAAENRRFCHRRLISLAAHVLNSNPQASPDQPGFWVHRAACNLLDAVSSHVSSSFESLQGKEQEDPHGQRAGEEFYELPSWLRAHAATVPPILPWLPLPSGSLPKKTYRHCDATAFRDVPEMMDLDTDQRSHCKPEPSPPPPLLDAHARARASDLKAELLICESTSRAITLFHEIQHLCSGSGVANQLSILSLIEPWEADDEIASVLLSNSSSRSCLVPDYILCSVVLPKLLVLRSPASRVLLSATIGFCKLHPTAAVDALIFPLVLRKEGINLVLCDVIARIMKECLHPSHISAFCQRLLCDGANNRKFLCLPCHLDLICDELVWTEALFMLFQHILNLDVRFTPDTIDHLVAVIYEMAGNFSRSLKFGNFVLCFVTKCACASTFHKPSLKRAAERTDTFVTKSILSKLGGM